MKLTVINLNLWWGGKLFPAAIDFLKAADADVVTLQEVHAGTDPGLKERQQSMQVLREQLRYPYDNFAKALEFYTPDGKIPLGNAILSKYTIAASSHIFLLEPTLLEYRDTPEHWPAFPRVLQGVRLDTPIGEVNIFNMHGVWDLDGDNPSPTRRTMIKRTLAAIKGKPNVILTGDTNATLGNPIWLDVEQELKSVFGNSLRTTFNMAHKTDPGYATAAVDHMYISPEIEIISAEVPPVNVSDHLPLVVGLEIN